jgi:hypothetical protein
MKFKFIIATAACLLFIVKEVPIVVSTDEYHAAINVTQIMIHDIFLLLLQVESLFIPNVAAYEIIAQSPIYKLKWQLNGLGSIYQQILKAELIYPYGINCSYMM